MTDVGAIAAAAELIRAGTGHPADLVRTAAARLREHNPRLNAVVAERADQAIAEAEALPRSGHFDGRLAGIPFTAKDMLATSELPTTCGSRALAGHHVGQDATAVARMKAAGAVLIGKTNCPEFALGVDTDNDLFGPTRNPLGPWTAGGSSGGEAAAIASGMSLIGLGSDYRGSLRWPAQCARLVGLRPTVGRVSRSGEQPDIEFDSPTPRSFQDTVQVIGPIGRTVEDVFTALNVICGPDGLDPLVADKPLRDYRDMRVADIDVAWAPTVGSAVVDPEVAEAVAAAAEALARAGAHVSQGVPAEIDRGLAVYDHLRAADPMTAIAHFHDLHPDLIGDSIRRMLQARVHLPSYELDALWVERDRLIARLSESLSGMRALLLPVSTQAPRDLTGRIADFHLLAPSRAVSLFGVPAVSVPVGTSRGGSPLSVQVIAPAFREDIALAVGQHLCDSLAGLTRVPLEAPDAH